MSDPCPKCGERGEWYSAASYRAAVEGGIQVGRENAELRSRVAALEAALAKIAAFDFAHNELADVQERFEQRSRDHVQMRLIARNALKGVLAGLPRKGKGE